MERLLSSRISHLQWYLLFALILLWCAASSAGELPSLKKGDLRGATIVSTTSYAGKALFGYIDGGAELYLEYKFKQLGRQEIRFAKEKFIVEVYQMEGPAEAYGIFSVERFKCVPIDTTFPNTCLSNYQLQAACGDCYLSIINETGSVSAQHASTEIFRALEPKIRNQEPYFPAIFKRPELTPHRRSLVLAFGPLGVQNSCPDWDPLFRGITHFTLSLVPIEIGSEHCITADIRFPSTRDCDEFCHLAGFTSALPGRLETMEVSGTNVTRFLRRIGDTEVLLVEASASFPDREPFVRLLSK